MMKLLLLLTAVLLASCRTMSDNQVAAQARAVTQSINGGDIDALNTSSGTPFLFETEILPSPVQLNALWEGLSASGYDFGPKGEITVSDPDETSGPGGEEWFIKSITVKLVTGASKTIPDDL